MSDESVAVEEAPVEAPVEAAPEAEAEVSSDDWRSPIEDPKAREFAEKMASPAAAAEMAFSLRQKLSSAIVVPGSDADDDAKADFRKKMGVPDSVDGYEIEAPEGLSDELQAQIFESDEGKAVLDRYRAIAYEHNITPEAFQALVNENVGQFIEAQTGQNRASEEAVGNAEASLKQEWGKDFDANNNYGAAAVRAFDTDGSFADLLEGTVVEGVQLGNHPAVRKAFAAIGRSMGEDGFHVAPSEGQSESINGELESLYALMDTDMEKYRSPSVQNKIAALEGKLHGDSPIVGSAGRSA